MPSPRRENLLERILEEELARLRDCVERARRNMPCR